MENNFNLNTFFNELNNNLLKENSLDSMVQKANDNRAFIWKNEYKELKSPFELKYYNPAYSAAEYYAEGDEIDFNPNYSKFELIFPILHRSLKYESIFTVYDPEDDEHDICTKYGYISSSKSEISFLIATDGYDVNVDNKTLRTFNKIKKTEFNDFPNLILEHYKTIPTYGTIGVETVSINENYKWDLNYLIKIFDKSLNEKRKHAEKLKRIKIKDYDHSIYIVKTKVTKTEGNKDTTVKILK